MALTALQLAAHAGLWISRVPDREVVARDGERLLIGPDADDDRIATIAAHRLVQLILQRDDVSEERVREEVAHWGFRYVAEPSPSRPTTRRAVALPVMSRRKRSA